MAKSKATARRNKKTRPPVNRKSELSVTAAPEVIRWLFPLMIFALTALIFLPSLQNGFVNWDDPANLLENPHYRGLTWSHLQWMFTTFHFSLYRPLTWMTFGIDYLIWGMNPFGYHLTSLLFHCANAVLFYLISLQLFQLATSNKSISELPLRLAAGFAALFFSLHPLRVEVVAWASARNDVLSGFFFLWTIYCYLNYAVLPKGDESRRRWFVGALIAYLLSLLAKAAAVSLPLVLLVLDVYPLRRLGAHPVSWFNQQRRGVWWEKLPFLLLAVVGGVAAFIAKYQLGSMASVKETALSGRIAQSLYGLFFYVWKTLIPIELSPLYELPLGLSILNYEIVFSGILILAVTGVFVAAVRRWPAGLVSWICYVLIVAPVLGIFQSGPQLAADRYSYLSCLGFATLAGASVIYFWRHWEAGRIRSRTLNFLQALPVVVLITFGTLTWAQAQVWRDSDRLWRHALAIVPSTIPHYNLGVLFAGEGKIDDAIDQFRKTVEISPSYGSVQYYLAKLLAQRGDLDEAAKHYRAAVELDPRNAEIYTDLGLVLARQGNFKDAIQHLRRALDLNPADARTHANLGRTLLQQGDTSGAIQHLSRALEVDPNNGEIHSTLAMVFSMRGEMKKASQHLRQALEINPNDAALRTNLAITMAREGDLQSAVKEFQAALLIAPNLAEAHMGLARLLATQGKKDEAIRHYQEAVRLLKSQRGTAGAPRIDSQ